MNALLESIEKSGKVDSPLIGSSKPEEGTVSTEENSAAAAEVTDAAESNPTTPKKGKNKPQKKATKQRGEVKDDVEPVTNEKGEEAATNEEEKKQEESEEATPTDKAAAQAKEDIDDKEDKESAATAEKHIEPDEASEEKGAASEDEELSESNSVKARGRGSARQTGARKSTISPSTKDDTTPTSKSDFPKVAFEAGEAAADSDTDISSPSPKRASSPRSRIILTARKTPASSTKTKPPTRSRTSAAAKDSTKKRASSQMPSKSKAKAGEGEPAKKRARGGVPAKGGRESEPEALTGPIEKGGKDMWPKGWTRTRTPRKNNPSIKDPSYYTPVEGFKLRSLIQVKRFLEALKKHKGDEKRAFEAIDGGK